MASRWMIAVLTAVLFVTSAYSLDPLHILVELPDSADENNTMFKNRNPFELTLNKSRPAIEIAVDDVTRVRKLLPIGSLQVTFKDSNMSDALGPHHAVEAYCAKKLDAVIGFAYVFALAPVARMSARWGQGVPVFTSTAQVDALDNREEFPLLTRMMGSYRLLAFAVLHWMRRMEYKHVAFVCHDHAYNQKQIVGRSECYFQLVAVKNIFLGSDIKWGVQVFNERSPQTSYDELLQRSSMKANGMICFLLLSSYLVTYFFF